MINVDRRTFMKGLVGLAASLLGLGNANKSNEMSYQTNTGVELNPQLLGEARVLTGGCIASGPVSYLQYHDTTVRHIAEAGTRRRPIIYNGGQLI